MTYWLRLVAHDQLAYDRYYNAVANGTFWFIQHYLWGLASMPDIEPSFRIAWRDGYQRVNRAFADMVLTELDRNPDAEVFLHDYHLYVTPGYVREARPDARLLQFIHIPWAESRLLARAARGRAARRARGPARERRRRLPHAPLAPQLRRVLPGDHGRGVGQRARVPRPRRTPHPRRRAADRDRPRRVRRAQGAPGACSRRSGGSSRRGPRC